LYCNIRLYHPVVLVDMKMEEIKEESNQLKTETKALECYQTI
jgi:FtsZ-binding cell division protein ZapB